MVKGLRLIKLNKDYFLKDVEGSLYYDYLITYTLIPTGEGSYFIRWVSEDGKLAQIEYEHHEVEQYIEEGSWIEEFPLADLEEK